MRNIISYALVLVIALTACNKKQTVVDPHAGHDHGEVKLFFTEYTDNLELFAEADPFVKGNSSEILAHFTKLEDFKPLDNVKITARLFRGEKEVKQTIEEPGKPGIYKFSITPDFSGDCQLVFEIKNNGKSEKIIINKLKIYTDEHTAIHIAEKKQKTYLNSISFTKEQSWKIDFATSSAKNEKFGKVIKTTAQLLPDQSGETMITAKTNGIVKFHKHVLEGQVIKPMESLLSISGKGLANDNAEVRYAEAKNNFEAAKSDFDRKRALAQKQIVSEKEVEEAKVSYENAKAVFENLKRNFNENGQVVFSTEKGRINHIHAENGQYVETGTPLFSMCNDHKLVIKAEVQQSYFPYLSSIESFNIKSTLDKKYYTDKELNGKLLSYGRHIEGDEGYLIPVNFQIDDNDDLLTGSFVELYIRTKSEKESLIVPNTGIIEEQGNYFVLVQRNPETFEKIEVKVGVTDGISTEILSGISNTDRVVTRGAMIVKLAAVSNSLDPHAGHVH